MILENRRFSYLIIITVLVIQNITIFWDQYFNRVGFPWDFSGGYFAWPAFWTTAVSQGIFPQWNPFQSLGYPLFMNAQSGFYYPFFWLFPVLSIPYTLDAAVIFQVVHVLLGSIGMFFFLKYMFNSPRFALIGAIAFQFFGGFFANAEHADIVRAFAISPWIFYVFTLNLKKPTFCRRTLFIPIVIFLLATGGYPGIFIASIFIMGLFVILQSVNGIVMGIGKRKSFVFATSLFGLMILGVAISAVHIGPVLQFGNDYLTNFGSTGSVPQDVLELDQFPGFFMSNNPIPGEISMTSTFLTLPIIIFASFFPLSSIKKYWIFFVIMIFAILMSAGRDSFIYQGLTSLIPSLELSRFPVSDFRAFIAIPMFIFAIVGLKAVVEGKFTLKQFFLRIGFILSWFSLGIYSLFANSSESKWMDLDLLNQQVVFAIAILAITITSLAIFITKKHGNLPDVKKSIELSIIGLIIFIIIVGVDGFRVTSDMVTWKMNPLDNYYVQSNLPLEQDGKLITYSIFENLPDKRPERKNPTNWFQKGLGNLNGDYLMQDYGSTRLKSRAIVENRENFQNFMFMEWTSLLVEPKVEWTNTTKITLPEKIFSNLEFMGKETSVLQTHYGVNDITYKVSLTEQKLMVENEMYFPGWAATLSYPDKKVELQSLVINNVFRAWLLPAGDYEMKAHFEFPNLLAYQSISIAGFVIWISIVITFWKKSNKS